MAWFGGRGAEARNDIEDRYQQLVNQDEYNSQHGMAPERLEVIDDAISDIVETMRGCEATDQVVDSMDADAKLMMEVLQERQGLWNIMYHINNNNAFRLLARSQIGQGLWNNVINRLHLPPGTTLAPAWRNRAEHVATAGAAVGKAMVVGNATRAVLGSVFGIGTVPLSFLAGGTTGLITGLRRGKERHESASAWMAELGVLSRRDGQTRNERVLNIDRMSDADLVRALSIMKQAVDDRRVRGNSQQKMEFAGVYRLIKNAIQERRETELYYNPENLTPIMSELDDSISAADEEGELISKFAAEKDEYRREYEKIIGLKKEKEKMTIIKSTIGGVVIGGTLGLVSEHGAEKAYETLKNFFHIGGDTLPAAKQEALTQLLEAKKEALLQGSSEINQEVATHVGNLDNLDKLIKGDITVDQLTPPEVESVRHMLTMRELVDQGIHVSTKGFHVGDMQQFNDMLNGGETMRTLYDFAGSHNIDLTYAMDNGQQFGQFIADHKDAFAAMPSDVQNFVLSHPSVAEQFFGLDDQATVGAFVKVGGKVLAAAGIAAAGGLFGWASKKQSQLRKEINSTFREYAKTDQLAEARHQKEFRVGTRTESIREIQESAWIRFLNVPGQTRRYRILGVDANGVMKLADFADPQRVIPDELRSLRIDDYLNDDRTINRNIIQIFEQRGADTEAEEAVNLENYEFLRGLHNLTGTVRSENGRRVVRFNQPARAARLGGIVIDANEPTHNPPNDSNLGFNIVNIRAEGNEPRVELEPVYNFGANEYHMTSNNVNADARREAGSTLRTLAASGAMDRVVIYFPTSRRFARLNGYDAGTQNFSLRTIVDPVAGTVLPAYNIPRNEIERLSTCLFVRE